MHRIDAGTPCPTPGGTVASLGRMRNCYGLSQDEDILNGAEAIWLQETSGSLNVYLYKN